MGAGVLASRIEGMDTFPMFRSLLTLPRAALAYLVDATCRWVGYNPARRMLVESVVRIYQRHARTEAASVRRLVYQTKAQGGGAEVRRVEGGVEVLLSYPERPDLHTMVIPIFPDPQAASTHLRFLPEVRTKAVESYWTAWWHDLREVTSRVDVVS